ncbi:MAG: hypothetical protein A2W26_04910 [Acidobacteria bacterium RBG_16_64_8]|nr:MAG: hypothetical protein A2W26_04910 [Acidobacteria bacterium RBG_16_64_8]
MDPSEALRDYILDDLQWAGKREELTADYPLVENHVVDSLGLFKLVSFVESHFGVTIEDEELLPENFGTIGAVMQLVERLRGAGKV